jgi:hypothetical protein
MHVITDKQTIHDILPVGVAETGIEGWMLPEYLP